MENHLECNILQNVANSSKDLIPSPVEKFKCNVTTTAKLKVIHCSSYEVVV